MNDYLGFRYERNQYFTGKLLTAQDFKVEQKYFNDKRRLLNRFLFGSGIVCGLDVTPTSDKSVTIDPGIALDIAGREIVVESLSTYNLSALSGFPAGEYYGALYLCIEYDEKDKDQVYSVENSEKDRSFNRTLEGYKLTVRKTPPDRSKNGLTSIMEDVRLIYEDEGMAVWHKSPKYANPGQAFEASFIFEKLKPIQKIGFEYEAACENSLYRQPEAKKLEFKEPDRSDKSEYEFKYIVTMPENRDEDCKLKLSQENMRLHVGDREVKIPVEHIVVIKSITVPVNDKIIEDYYNLSLDKWMDMCTDKSIVLAKINIIQASSAVGTTYYIDRIEKIQSEAQVFNIPLLGLLYRNGSERNKNISDILREAMNEVSAGNLPGESKEEMQEKGSFEEEEPFQSTTGFLELAVEAGSKKSYYTDEISHGLGTGNVFVTVGIYESQGSVVSELTQNDEQIYIGEPEVFNKSPYAFSLPHVSTGVIVYPKKGTFRVGLAVNGTPGPGKIKLRWWASKAPEISGGDQNGTPEDSVEIKFGQDFPIVSKNGYLPLSASVTGTKNKGILWKVNEANGGSVSENGIYTAPGLKGVYSVTASSKAYPAKSATVYIIVN